jgi:hypothetical protein
LVVVIVAIAVALFLGARPVVPDGTPKLTESDVVVSPQLLENASDLVIEDPPSAPGTAAEVPVPVEAQPAAD